MNQMKVSVLLEENIITLDLAPTDLFSQQSAAARQVEREALLKLIVHLRAKAHVL